MIDLSSYYLGSLPLHQREGHTFDLQKPVLHSNKFFAVTTAKNNNQKRVKAVQIVYDAYTCMCARLFDIAVHCSLVNPAIKYNICTFVTNTGKIREDLEKQQTAAIQFNPTTAANHLTIEPYDLHLRLDFY